MPIGAKTGPVELGVPKRGEELVLLSVREPVEAPRPPADAPRPPVEACARCICGDPIGEVTK